MNKKACELCGVEIEYPAGVCLPVQQPDKDESLKFMKVIHSAFQHGLRSMTLQRRFSFFVCDQCVTTLHAEHGVSPDPLDLEMARNRALYLWDAEIREKEMRPDEFPLSPEHFDVSWFDERLGRAFRALLASRKTERDKIALYTNAMARQMQFRQRSRCTVGRGVSGQAYIAVTAEPAFGDVTGPFFDELAARWLLKDLGKDTAIYCSAYNFPHWISYAMAPLLAVAISLNMPAGEGQSDEEDESLSWQCYVNTTGGRCMVVFWDA